MRERINSAITVLGERFNFDAHYFTKNTFWLLIGQGMMSVAAFFTAIVLANYVSKQNVGDYRLIISFYAVLAFFSLPGIATALMHSVVNGKEGAFFTALRFRKWFSVLACCMGFLIAYYFGILKNNPVFGLSVAVMAACLPIIETYSLYIIYLQSRSEYKYSSLNTGLVKVISATAVIVVAYLYPSAFYLIAALYLSQAVVTYMQFRLFIKKFPIRNTTEDEGMMPYAKHLTFAGGMALFLAQADKLILYHFFGPVALAQYWIASTIPQEIGRVIWTVSQVSYPKFIKGDHAEMRKWLPKKLWYITLILILLSALYALIAYPLFGVLFPEYLDQVTKSIVLMFAFVVAPYTLVWIFFTAQRNVKVAYISNTVDPLLQITLYIILIPLYGIWGLVYALLVKTIVMNGIAWFVLKRY